MAFLFHQRLEFNHPGLNKAIAYVHYFLQTHHNTEWLHVKIRAPAMQSFYNLLNAQDERVRTLNFSCWCNGGDPEEAFLRQHRHFIVVCSPPGYFEEHVERHIQLTCLPHPDYKGIYSKRIVSAMQLVNTMGSLSTHETRCLFDCKGPLQHNHFKIFMTLSRNYKLPCVLQWDGGILELLDQEYHDLDLDAVEPSAFQFVQNKWRIKIRNLPGIQLKTVLRIQPEYAPCEGPTPFFVHLIRGRKIYFEWDCEHCNLTKKEWLQKQVDGGNVFYGVVANEYWTPRPELQSLIAQRMQPSEGET